MLDRETNFAGAIAGLYDAILGPFMFEPFAREMAGRLAGADGQVLEIAAGTGIVTRELDRVLAPGARLTATDLNPPMLAVAQGRGASGRVSWRQADALALPFPDQAFDAVVCQFGVMFYPDQVAGHAEAFRVLKPGGRHLFSVWGPLAANPVAEIVHETVAACWPKDPPGFFARTPHGHHDEGVHRANLARAGFGEATAEMVTLPAGRLAAAELAVGFCQGTPLRNEIEARGEPDLVAVTKTVEAALRARFGDGPVESTIQALIVDARA